MHVGFALDLDRAWGYCSSARTWLLHCKISERGYARRSFGRGVLSLKSHCALKAFFLSGGSANRWANHIVVWCGLRASTCP